MNPSVFREYDIRGVAARDLTSDFVRDLGRAFAAAIAPAPGEPAEPGPVTVCVGRDCRESSPRLFEAFVDGLTAAGADVIDIGVVPTPVLYYAAFAWQPTGAVIITGSHNPGEDNGFKMLRGQASLHGDAIRNLHRSIEAGLPAQAPRRGRVEERDAVTPYLEHAASCLSLGPRRFPVVVDAGNGTGGPVATALYRKLGFEVRELYCDMDGTFPNHHPDPTVEENLLDLRRAVVDAGAELGIALDGDADRLGALDGRGRVLWGDQLMILFGRAILREHPGARFIGEVKCSQALYDELSAAGGEPIMWKVGHSLIKAKMKESGALLAGEMSGHIFFGHRYLGFDDGIYSGARLLELLSRGDTTLAELYETLPVMVNTPEIRVPCNDEHKFAVVARAAARLGQRDDVLEVIDVDGARARFADGWGLVRASNTQPSLVVRCEAVDAERLDRIRGILEEEIAKAREQA